MPGRWLAGAKKHDASDKSLGHDLDDAASPKMERHRLVFIGDCDIGDVNLPVSGITGSAQKGNSR
jgi:hypothetical protein